MLWSREFECPVGHVTAALVEERRGEPPTATVPCGVCSAPAELALSAVGSIASPKDWRAEKRMRLKASRDETLKEIAREPERWEFQAAKEPRRGAAGVPEQKVRKGRRTIVTDRRHHAAG